MTDTQQVCYRHWHLLFVFAVERGTGLTARFSDPYGYLPNAAERWRLSNGGAYIEMVYKSISTVCGAKYVSLRRSRRRPSSLIDSAMFC
jgi:hypothetical protein